MNKVLVLLVVSMLMSGCYYVTDPLGTSTEEVKAAYPKAQGHFFAQPVEKVREKVKAIADVNAWHIFQDLPENELFVIINVPGYIDTTEVAIFVEKYKTGTIVRIASLNRQAQRDIAEEVLELLQAL